MKNFRNTQVVLESQEITKDRDCSVPALCFAIKISEYVLQNYALCMSHLIEGGHYTLCSDS